MSMRKERVPTQQEDVNFFDEKSITSPTRPIERVPRPKLPIAWQGVVIFLTCMCTFGVHWSNGLITALKTTIISNLKINNSEFAILVAVTNLVNTFLCIAIGFCIDRWGGLSSSIVLATFHLAGAAIMAGAATNDLNSYPLLIVGKVIAAIGDGSLDNAQHRIFSTYFAPGKGFAFSIGAIWSIANLAQFVGHSTANVIAQNLGSYAWTLWISAVISFISVLCAISVAVVDRYLRAKYEVIDHTSGKLHGANGSKSGVFKLSAINHLPLTFWVVVLFAVFENAGVQSFVSISTQFAQQRLKKGAVVGGWVSSFYLLLPVGLTPFLGILIDGFGHRVTLLFMSGLTFLISMALLKASHTVPAFVAAYVFYALAQCVTPAPQVEIIRNIIPDPQYFATGFAIKKSVVQASIVIITTAQGRLQDLSPTDSLDPAVSLWLAYAVLSVVISGGLLLATYTPFGRRAFPAARLSQVSPRHLKSEVERLWMETGADQYTEASEDTSLEARETVLKSPRPRRLDLQWTRWLYPVIGFSIVVIGWVMFGFSVGWGVIH